MRYLTLILLVGCSKKLDPPAAVPAPPALEAVAEVVAKQAEPAPEPLNFDVGGMHVGDEITADFVDEHCIDADGLQDDMECIESIEVGGHKVYLFRLVRDRKLASVSLVFDSGMYSDVLAAYTAKFGRPPHTLGAEAIKTRAGVEYTNQKATCAQPLAAPQ